MVTGTGKDGSGGPSWDLLAAVTRIVAPDGTVTGAGFLVADNVVVTCAHVVEAAGSGPGGTILLDFPHVEGAERLEGHVPVDLWRAVEREDVAFIRLVRAPAGARTLPLGSAEGCRGHQVVSFGFPAQAPPEGHFGFGVAGDLLPGAQGRSTLLQLTAANDLTTGFSGGPVLDEMTSRVVGIVTEIAAPDQFERGQGVAYVTPTQVLREVLPELTEHGVCPYRGLEPFTEEHARWFRGREDAVRQVVTNLARQQRLTLLLGPSGSGKSSLIQAGVLRALAEGKVPGSDSWLTVLARPRQDLAVEIERAGLAGAGAEGIGAAVSRQLAGGSEHQRILLVIDQFEELFTQAADGDRTVDGRRADHTVLTDQIVEAVDSHTGLSVILVMRDDFYPQLAAFAPGLLERATPGLLNVPGTLSHRDLEDIITLPARDVGLRFQPGLPEQIVTDVLASTPEEEPTRQASVTVLPLLELTLSQLWLRREDGYLTHEAYRQIGAVSGSLTTWCDSALDELSAGQRPVARRILTSLVHPADPSRRIPPIRAQVPLGELRELAADPDGAAGNDIDGVLAVLTRHRIITTQTLRDPRAPDGPPGEPVAELIHDALIRDWGTLRDWVRQDRRFHEWLDATRERQVRWADKADQGDLLGGTALAEGLELSQKHRLPGDISAFLTASRDRQRAAIRRSRRLNTILATLLALALVAAGGAFWQWRAAVTERQAAQSRQLAAQSGNLIASNPELASLLAVQAYRTSHTSEAVESVNNAAMLPRHRRLSGHAYNVYAVAFSPDGRTLASGSSDATVRLWDTTTGKSRATLDHGDLAVVSLTFSPNGRILATGSNEGPVRLWDVPGRKPLATLTGHTKQVNSVAFSADGLTLATGSNDTTVRLWDTTTRKSRAILREHTDIVRTVAFSPDGQTLATGGDDTTARLWDTDSGSSLRKLPEQEGSVGAVLFSPDGRTLVTENGDGSLGLWDVASGKARSTFYARVNSMALSPDGTMLATGSPEHSVQVWDVTTGAVRATLLGHTNEVTSVAFSPDGRTLASGSHDSTARLWDVADRTVLTGHTGAVLAVAFSPDSRTLATGGAEGTIKLWDVAGGKPRRTLKLDSTVLALAFSPDGKTLATGGWGSAVQLWDVAGGTVRTTLNVPTDKVNAVAFTPDGNSLATANSDGVAALWNIATRKVTTVMGEHTTFLTSLAISADGRTLVTGSGDRTARLWDVATGKALRTLSGHTDRVTSVAFGPDGHTVVTGSYDRTVRLWDATTGKTRGTLIGHNSEVDSVTFGPDGRTVATSGSEGTVRLWDTGSGKTLTTLIGHSDEVWSVVFSPNGRTIASGSMDMTARLWNVAVPSPAAAIKKICQSVDRDLTPAERTAYLRGQSGDPVCTAD
ncbi:nSTAND1 domain-containing NTPase [Streptomyces sp. NBC_00239]|uniref:nSTAND1 domain-containing NTPase n=1 Tax=Streptomyces sp. NBC_00239 TaxID=2903640 RepID=UPI002E2E6A48|nr:trypsin-like peptidase domain-containing protein [Streptomyces sp. NBC_00239]